MLHIVLVYTLNYTYSPYNFLAGPLLSCILIIQLIQCLACRQKYIYTFILYKQHVATIATSLLSGLVKNISTPRMKRPCRDERNSHLYSQATSRHDAWRVKGVWMYHVCMCACGSSGRIGETRPSRCRPRHSVPAVKQTRVCGGKKLPIFAHRPRAVHLPWKGGGGVWGVPFVERGSQTI